MNNNYSFKYYYFLVCIKGCHQQQVHSSNLILKDFQAIYKELLVEIEAMTQLRVL